MKVGSVPFRICPQRTAENEGSVAILIFQTGALLECETAFSSR